MPKPTRTRRNDHEKQGKLQHRYGHDVGTHKHYPGHLGPPPDPPTANRIREPSRSDRWARTYRLLAPNNRLGHPVVPGDRGKRDTRVRDERQREPTCPKTASCGDLHTRPGVVTARLRVNQDTLNYAQRREERKKRRSPETDER